MRSQNIKRNKTVEQRFAAWLKKYHNDEMIHQAKQLPLRQDMLTLLTYVRDNRVVGTQSTGNLPLKAVRELTAQFVNPPKLEYTIGETTFRIRSEADLWSLYLLHILADTGQILAMAPGRRWQLTEFGKRYFFLSPLMQVSFLLSTWWYQVNWLVVFPFKGIEDILPPRFKQDTLKHLLGLPLVTEIAFEDFANSLIETAGLNRTARSSDFAPMLLRASIEKMIINILREFGALNCTYRDEPLGSGTISKLSTFVVTPFGKALMDALEVMRD